jgi:peptide/nickel transport system permease protein
VAFAQELQWLPSSGYVSPLESLALNLKTMLLPAVTLGTGLAAIIMRMTRSSLLEVLRHDYILTARAKGLSDLLQGPSRQHPLGTDDLGRDVLSRLMWGARVSLQVGVIAVGIALVTGTILGLLSGYVGGMLDNWLMRLMDALLAFPVLVLALALAAILSPSLSNVMLAIGVVGVPTYARLVRGQVLSVREWEFVQAAKAVGGTDLRILLQHVLPSITAPIIVEASLHIAAATLAEAGLSFLGLGVQPPTPSWGAMLNVGRGYLEVAPWMAMAPGAAIFLTVLGFNFLGDGVRDALDPRLKQL